MADFFQDYGGSGGESGVTDHAQNTDTGTDASSFQIGTGGPRVARVSDGLVVRDAANSGNAPLSAGNLEINTGGNAELAFQVPNGAVASIGFFDNPNKLYGVGYGFDSTENEGFLSAYNGAGMIQVARWSRDGSVLRSLAVLYVGSDIVWHAGNDGPGSGLDADTVDGVHAADFSPVAGSEHGAFRIGNGTDGPLLKREGANALSVRGNVDADWADLTVRNLTVKGTTTTIDSETVAIADNILTLNSDVTGTPPSTVAGIEVERGDELNARFVFDEGDDTWKAGIAGSEAGVSLVGHGHVGSDIADMPWTTLTGVPTTFAPSAHAASHKTGGADALSANDVGAYSKADLWRQAGISPVSIAPSLHFRPDVDALPDGVTFSRNSIATYFDAAGVLRIVAVDVPRFAYHPVTGRRLGFLNEEGRVNAIYPSEDFADATYTKGDCSITSDAIVSPNSEVLADKIVEGSTDSTHYMFTPSTSFTAGSAYTLSVYVKPSGRSTFRLSFPSGAFDTAVAANFTLIADGSVTMVTHGTNSSAQIEAISDGWYRCSITATATVTIDTLCRMSLLHGELTSYPGDGVSGVFLWGAQRERGAFATSYIPTTDAPVTRVADICTVLSSAFPFGLIGNTLYLEFVSFATDNNSRRVLSLYQDDDNRLSIYSNNSSLFAFARIGGINGSTVPLGDALNTHCIAISITANRLHIVMDGEAVQTDISLGNIPEGIISVGNYHGVTQVQCGSFRHVAIIPRALDIPALQQLTQGVLS
ncbi:phage head spike fiber domain-containing protein [Desulfovibrio inopinatus]|uniref:phage head spike fiber domain-containing protein n=1 Tax=Desulfovibrio inopinatus TaxID=102109 RepID=UPI00040F1568|nr:hypothetical protein [Desulfovibrio inopinatus]